MTNRKRNAGEKQNLSIFYHLKIIKQLGSRQWWAVIVRLYLVSDSAYQVSKGRKPKVSSCSTTSGQDFTKNVITKLTSVTTEGQVFSSGNVAVSGNRVLYFSAYWRKKPHVEWSGQKPDNFQSSIWTHQDGFMLLDMYHSTSPTCPLVQCKYPFKIIPSYCFSSLALTQEKTSKGGSLELVR